MALMNAEAWLRATVKTVVGCVLLIAFGQPAPLAGSDEDPRVGPVPASVRQDFNLAPHYQKFVDAGGLPVVASARVSDVALLEARFLILQMIGHRADLLPTLARNHVRFAVMAVDEFTTQIPEHRDLTPRLYWDKRARGLGATPARPAVSCGEENLLGLPGDPYAAENILVHEFAHAVHQMGVNSLDPSFQGRLQAAFDSARERGLWKNTYADSNVAEYFAEGAQSWFDTNRENDHDHNHVNTRAELKAHDAGLARLCEEVFGDRPWRYERPAARVPASLHFAGFDLHAHRRFSWPAELLAWNERFRRGEVTLAPADARPLAPEPPAARTVWQSADGGARVPFYVQNARAETVLLFWMDREGVARPSGKLRPAEHTRLSSFTGHVFRVTDEASQVLHYFVVGAGPSVGVIR